MGNNVQRAPSRSTDENPLPSLELQAPSGGCSAAPLAALSSCASRPAAALRDLFLIIALPSKTRGSDPGDLGPKIRILILLFDLFQKNVHNF